MSDRDTIEILLRRGAKGQEPLDPAEWKRVKARLAWVRETVAALAEAQRRMHERCLAAVNQVPEDEFDRICDEEQAKVDAIRAQIEAVIRGDRWPAALYFGGL
jgi:hypothetical protein